MAIRAPWTRVLRLLFAALLGTLALAPAASAKYLHLDQAKSAAQQYAQIEADATTYSVTVGSCWHAGPHPVQCSMTEDARYSGIFKRVAVIALRGDKLYGHTLRGEERTDRRHYIGRLGG
jgi:hypothetical protein